MSAVGGEAEVHLAARAGDGSAAEHGVGELFKPDGAQVGAVADKAALALHIVDTTVFAEDGERLPQRIAAHAVALRENGFRR